MPSPLSGPGIGLNLPQYLYPTELVNSPYDIATNRVAMSPGATLPIPAGNWYISLNFYNVIQYLDPITGTWVFGTSASYQRGVHYVKSDGFNCRVANLLGCPASAVVTSQGGGWVQASTTITVTGGGGSTWQPIVGGELGFSTVVTANAGAGYGIAPLVFIPAPPPAANNPNGVGGVPASGYVGISNGTVSGFTFTNPGAGYPTAPTPVVLPSPFDPNLATGITQATLAFSLITGGGITGVLNTNPGAPLAAINGITLSVNGVGSNATVTAMCMQTVTAASIPSGAAAGWGTVSALVQTVGGAPTTGGIVNPDSLHIAWLPRPAQIALAVTGAGSLAPQVGTIYDGGLFLTNATPAAVVSVGPPLGNGSLALETASIVLTMGAVTDFVTLQPAP